MRICFLTFVLQRLQNIVKLVGRIAGRHCKQSWTTMEANWVTLYIVVARISDWLKNLRAT